MVEKISFESACYKEGEVQKTSFKGDKTTVLAFFPGAFTGPCTEEMCEFRDSIKEFEELDAKVLGISVDTPFSLKEFSDQNNLNFPLVSDTSKEISENYGVKTVFPDLDYEISERAVFVVQNGEVVYKEVMDDPHNLPDMEKLKEKIRNL